MILAQLPWTSVLVLALIPAAARLPVPPRSPIWVQSMLLALYTFAVAAAACYLAWHGSGSTG